MKTFKDSIGRDWSASVNTGALKRVRDALGVNLGDTSKMQEFWHRVQTDDLFVIEVVSEVVRPQWEDRKMTLSEFADALIGDSIADAARALMEGLADFFRHPALRKLASKLSEVAGKSYQAAVDDAASQKNATQSS